MRKLYLNDTLTSAYDLITTKHQSSTLNWEQSNNLDFIDDEVDIDILTVVN